VTTQKKQKKDRFNVQDSTIAADSVSSTSKQNRAGNMKKKRKKNSEAKLPTISDDRLKAYGINPKKFKYVHRKKLLEQRR